MVGRVDEFANVQESRPHGSLATSNHDTALAIVENHCQVSMGGSIRWEVEEVEANSSGNRVGVRRIAPWLK